MFSIARTIAKTPRDLREGMRLVKECLRIIWECQYQLNGNNTSSNLAFWVIENPYTGMLKNFLGNPSFRYCHSEYNESHTKRTALWGLFNIPIKPLLVNPMLPGNSLVGDKTTAINIRDKEERMQIRSNAPKLFTKLFFEANQ